MTYSPNIPQPTDNPSDSQSLILQNFQQLNLQYGTSGDHVPFTATSQNGKHNLVTWIDQTANLPIVAGISEVKSYSQTRTGITRPYYERDTISSATVQFPLSPIQAYATFRTLAAPGVITALDSFNITSITQASGSLINLVLTNACRTLNFGVFPVSSDNARGLGYGTSSTVDFQINTNVAWVAGITINVLVMET
jgi:hypothetical protein